MCSYEELLLESSDEEGEQEQGKKKKKKAVKTSQGQGAAAVQGGRGRAWIREGTEDEPLNFLDPSVTKSVSGE